MENTAGQQVVMEEGSVGPISQSPQISFETEVQTSGRGEMLRSEHLQLDAQATAANIKPLKQLQMNGENQTDFIEICERGSQLQITEGKNVQNERSAQNEMIEWQSVEKTSVMIQGEQEAQIQISAMQMPEGMQSQQLSFLEENEIVEQISLSDMTTQEPSQHVGGRTIQRQGMPIQQYALEIQTQKMSFAECGRLQEQQLQMGELTIQEMPLELIDQELQMQQLSARGQERCNVEGGIFQKKHKQIGEMTMPVKMSPQEGMQINQEYVQETLLEIQSQDRDSLEEDLLQEEQLPMIEITTREIISDMREKREQIQDMNAQEIPEFIQDMQSQEMGHFKEGFLIQERLQKSEKETYLNTSGQGMHVQEIYGLKMCKDEQQLPHEVMKKQGSEATGLPESSWSTVAGTVDEQEPEDSWSMEVIGTIHQQTPEQRWSKEVIGTMEEQTADQSWGMDVIGTIEQQKLDQSCDMEVIATIEQQSPQQSSDMEAIATTEQQTPKQSSDMEIIGTIEQQTPKQSCDMEIIGTIEQQTPQQSCDLEIIGTTEQQTPDQNSDIEVIATIEQQTPQQGSHMEVIATAEQQTTKQSSDMEIIGTIEQQTPKQSCDLEIIGTIEQQTAKQSCDMEVTGTVQHQTPKQNCDMEVIGTIEQQTPKQSSDMEVIGTVQQRTPKQSCDMEIIGTVEQQTPDKSCDMEIFGTGEQQTPEQSCDMEIIGSVEQQTPEQSCDMEIIGTVEQQTPDKSCDMEIFGTGEQQTPDKSCDMEIFGTGEQQTPEQSCDMEIIVTVEQQTPEQSCDMEIIGTVEQQTPDQSCDIEVNGTIEEQPPHQSCDRESFGTFLQQTPEYSCSTDVTGNIGHTKQEQSLNMAIIVDPQNPEQSSNGKVIETIQQQDPEKSSHGKIIETVDQKKLEQSSGTEVTESINLQKSDQRLRIEGFEAIDMQKPEKSSSGEAIETLERQKLDQSSDVEVTEIRNLQKSDRCSSMEVFEAIDWQKPKSASCAEVTEGIGLKKSDENSSVEVIETIDLQKSNKSSCMEVVENKSIGFVESSKERTMEQETQEVVKKASDYSITNTKERKSKQNGKVVEEVVENNDQPIIEIKRENQENVAVDERKTSYSEQNESIRNARNNDSSTKDRKLTLEKDNNEVDNKELEEDGSTCVKVVELLQSNELPSFVSTDDKNECTKKQEGISSLIAQGGSCSNMIVIDEYLESITRLEKERHYLEGRDDEQRTRGGNMEQYLSEGQVTISEDNDHTSIMDDSANSLDLDLENHHDERCFYNHTCHIHGEIESPRGFDRLLADKAYYKSKYEQIKREKERLERAYEVERRQKEEFEMEYLNEKDEKFYLEQRRHEMVQHLNRFEETIHSLRQDNKLLQKNLNEWATSKPTSNKEEVTAAIAGQMVDGDHSTGYKKHLETLERENKEFKSILDVLSKKNEKEEDLRQIELGLARENELIELRREKARLGDSIRELKRTNKNQQKELEEIRNESAEEISQHRDKCRRLEKTIKDKNKLLEEKEDKIDMLKKRHFEEVHVFEIRLQNEVSCRSQVQNQMRDLEVKVQLLEQERSHLKEEVSALSNPRDEQFGMDSAYQDVKMIRQKYEDERRNKFKLANDIKYLLSDIMDLKERNRTLQEDFTRERIEIKTMIEKQANEITQVHLLQINKLQRSLMEETKRRQEAEARQSAWIPESNDTFIADGKETNSFPHSNMQAQLRNEIQRRKVLEIENKTLLQKMNELLSGDGNYSEEISVTSKNSSRTPCNQREVRDMLRGNDELNNKNRGLESEVEDLKEKLEELKRDAKKKKELSRRNDHLEEEVTHLSRKRDELLAARRNLTREVESLSNNLDEAEQRNRKLLTETERLTRKIQVMDDSFRQDRIALTRHYENEKERTAEEMNKMKETAEKRLYQEIEKSRQLTDKLKKLEEAHGSDSEPVKSGSSYGHSTFPTNANFPFGGSGDFLTKSVHSPVLDTGGRQVERLEKMLQDVNKRHEAELENLNLQKKNMTEEFLKEKQSLEQYFQQEHAILQKRLLHVENSIMLGQKEKILEPRSFHSMNGCCEQIQSRLMIPGREEALSRKTYVDREKLDPIESNIEKNMYDGLNNPPRPGDNLSKLEMQMQSKNDQESNETLYHVTWEKRRLEDVVQETKRKLEECRRSFEDEIKDLKRKHRREQNYLNDKLIKERAEFEKTLRAERNASKTKFGIPAAQNMQNEQGQSSKMRRDIQELKDELKSQEAALKAGFEVEKQEVYRKIRDERKKVMETIQKLKQSNNALKCEKRELEKFYRKELEKLKRVHEVEKVRIQEKAVGDSAEEASRLNDEYQNKMTSERKKLQSSIDELRRKLSMAEKKMKDMEMEQKEEKERYEEEKRHIQSSLIHTNEELKVVYERDYRKRLSDERQKFEQTVESMTQQILLLQNQRKEIQGTLLNSDLMGKYKITSDQLSRRTVVLQLEEEFLERVSRERRPMEEKIKELQQEISKHKKERKELKATFEKEKQELEEEMENLKENMTRKLSKAREKIEQKTEALGSITSNRMISLMVRPKGALKNVW